MRLQSIKENLLVIGVFTGLLLPMRLLFNHYLNHYWIGTFGVFSIVMFCLLYLSKKGKLGNIGNTLIRKINKRASGKLGIGFIITSVFVIYLSSLAVLGSSYADPKVVSMVTDTLHQQGIHDMKSMISQPLPQPTPIQIIISIIVTVTPNPISFAMFHSMNDLSNGWMLSLFTIMLIEEMEVLGIILFLRYKNRLDA